MVSAPARPPLEAAKYWQPAAPVAVKSSLPKTNMTAVLRMLKHAHHWINWT